MAIDYRPNTSARSTTLISIVVVVAVLYFARVVLIPFALAILVSFLLAPLALRLRHWRFGRMPGILLVVVLAFAVLGVTAGVVSVQLADLTHKLPEYQENIQRKVQSIRESSSGTINRLSRVIHDFTEELNPVVTAKSKPGEEKPVPVEIRRTAFSPVEAVRSILGSVINVLLTVSIVVVFAIFILYQREDLRDRLIRLVGTGRINLTTQALDDAAHRLSRYLLAQLAVNVMFGTLAGVGLYFMGVPNPILWAVLAVMFRYVPYLGIWMAACMPAGVVLAISPGWLEPLEVFTLYFGIDLLVLNFVEPLLYGSSTGISPLAILVAAVFWTWLWGSIGLLLSTPLTVCLVVIGRYVPSLEFLSVLLGDEPVLSVEKRFYQRLLAMDLAEATIVAEDFVREAKSLEELYDRVIIPALGLAEQDRHRNRLDLTRQESIFQNTRMVAEDIADRFKELTKDKSPQSPSNDANTPDEHPGRPEEVCVLSMPARDEADEIAASMLARLLNDRGVSARIVSVDALASERVEVATRERIEMVCICAIPPFGHMHARYLCKRLRTQFSDVKIVAAILNEGDVQELKKHEPSLEADQLATSLRQAVAEIIALVPCSRKPAEPVLLGS